MKTPRSPLIYGQGSDECITWRNVSRRAVIHSDQQDSTITIRKSADIFSNSLAYFIMMGLRCDFTIFIIKILAFIMIHLYKLNQADLV